MCSPGYCWSSGVPSPNAGIPLGGLVENKVIEIGGTYSITISVTFKNCTFRMSGDARINISPVSADPVNVTFDNCDLFGCGQMWQGIVVDATGASGDFTFDFLNGTIEDAYIGLRLDEFKGDYSIADNSFRNNHIGISNVRENGSTLNGVIVRNHFWQTANLATRTGSLAPPFPMLDYPLAHGGVKYIDVVSTVGVLQTIQTGNTVNIFECLVNGILTGGPTARVQSISNHFQAMGLYGIYAFDGALRVSHCHFLDSGHTGIYALGATIKVADSFFSGDWKNGISSAQNPNAEDIRIERNTFVINTVNWFFGITVQRSDATSGRHCFIDHNVFTVTTKMAACIRVRDFLSSTDEAVVSWNTINASIPSAESEDFVGIELGIFDSDNYILQNNFITFGATTKGWGVKISDLAGTSIGHAVLSNTVIGGSTFTSMECGFHTNNAQSVNYCYNILDQSYRGFHFTGDNDITLSENQINYHVFGLMIWDKIGAQHGKGNLWNTDPNACARAASVGEPLVPGMPNPFNSEFVVPEGNVLPWLPPANKIFPNPSLPGQEWFYFGPVPIDYCAMLANPEERKLSDREQEVVDGLSQLSGVALWDKKRTAYTKLLLYPALRPTGSPEAAFFNAQAGSSIAAFGQVELMLQSGTALSAADQQTFDTYRSATEQTFAALAAWESLADYSAVENLSEAWFAQRATLLQTVRANADNEAALESTRNVQTAAALTNALSYNTNISSTQPHEAAAKSFNDIRIRLASGEDMTAALYQQALNLAQQDLAIAGRAAQNAVVFLAPCDELLYLEQEPAAEERHDAENATMPIANVPNLQLAPNPSTGNATVLLPTIAAGVVAVFSSTGQKVHAETVAPNTHSLVLDLAKCPQAFTGSFFLMPSTGRLPRQPFPSHVNI